MTVISALDHWQNPLPLRLVPSADTDSYRTLLTETSTPLPLPPHPGAFGVARKFHVHEGVDLYCAPNTVVRAIEDGQIVNIIAFTGANAEPPSPHWHDTKAVLVEGASGVIVYGEIRPETRLTVGQNVRCGERIGFVIPVLKTDKGRPMTMLHLELHDHGTRDAFEWAVNGIKPPSLRDPTEGLLAISRNRVAGPVRLRV